MKNAEYSTSQEKQQFQQSNWLMQYSDMNADNWGDAQNLGLPQ